LMLTPFAPFVCEAIQTQFVPKNQNSWGILSPKTWFQVFL
jgi:hypothetical protein